MRICFMDAGFIPSIKCVLIGDYEVGKTSLINAFATREPLNQYFPGLTGPVQIHIEHAFRLYLLHIHDTEGTHAPTPRTTPAPSPPLEDGMPTADLSEVSIYLDESSDENQNSRSNKWISRRVEYGLADVVLICFSLANRASFENVEMVWRREIEQFCPHIPFIILGCKLDLRRPDPTTPAAIPRRRPQPGSPILQLRRPKPARSSTASTNDSFGPGSPSTSDFGHPIPESSASHSSITHPVSILTNTQNTHEPPRQVTSTSGHTGGGGGSSAPASDVETTGKKLRPKSSFPIPFPGAKAFRRKSVTDVLTSLSRPPSSFSSPTTMAAPVDVTVQPSTEQPGIVPSAASSATAPAPVRGTPPKSHRHVRMPPFIRSISHANVFRKVLNRSRSGTMEIESPVDSKQPASASASSPNATEIGNSLTSGDPTIPPVRPLLAYRFTSGSADDSSVRKLHSHIRTSSQPSPMTPDLQLIGAALGGGTRLNAPGVPDGASGIGGSVARAALVPVGSDGAGGSGSSSSGPQPSPGRGKMTRIEEPPLSMRRRTTTYQEARASARRMGASGYMECSSLTLVNVVTVFDEAVRIAVERRQASASSLQRHGKRGKQKEECVIM